MNRGSFIMLLELTHHHLASMRPRFMNRGSKIAVQLHAGGVLTLQ